MSWLYKEFLTNLNQGISNMLKHLRKFLTMVSNSKTSFRAQWADKVTILAININKR